jgi:hypothetical protein
MQGARHDAPQGCLEVRTLNILKPEKENRFRLGPFLSLTLLLGGLLENAFLDHRNLAELFLDEPRLGKSHKDQRFDHEEDQGSTSQISW